MASLSSIEDKGTNGCVERFYSATQRAKFDPLIEQLVNQKLFEDMLRTHLQAPPQAEASNLI